VRLIAGLDPLPTKMPLDFWLKNKTKIKHEALTFVKLMPTSKDIE
jgi:hypothetical protein